jgi:hypothetical protein
MTRYSINPRLQNLSSIVTLGELLGRETPERSAARILEDEEVNARWREACKEAIKKARRNEVFMRTGTQLNTTAKPSSTEM